MGAAGMGRGWGWAGLGWRLVVLCGAFFLGRQLGSSLRTDSAAAAARCPAAGVVPEPIVIEDPCPVPAAAVAAAAAASAAAVPVSAAAVSYFSRPVHADDTCPPTVPSDGVAGSYIYKNRYRRLRTDGLGLQADGVLKDVFGYLHHPSCPTQADLVLTSQPVGGADGGTDGGADGGVFAKDFSQCRSVFAMRSGSRDDQPCKCVGVVRVPPYEGHVSEMSVMHRTGHIDWPQVLTDQYQDDIVHYYSLAEERNLTSLFLRHRQELIDEFLRVMGPPVDKNGTTRTALLMVANAGVMDLVLNFMCSTSAAGIDMSSFVVFLGQEEYKDLVTAMGGKSMFHPALGDMPAASAASYADRTFSRVMWLKVTSVYIALSAGFNVIFQDADLVWIQDPVPFLMTGERLKYDMIFMDDGARTPRFSPFFTNTGFYFARRTDRVMLMQERLIRAVGEISYTASHQATFIRHLTEAHYAFALAILILDDNLFPSGQMYHHQPNFVSLVKNYERKPFVWHMCWTAVREQKVAHFKDLGLWYLPDPKGPQGDGGFCENPPAMLGWTQGIYKLSLEQSGGDAKRAAAEANILRRCCVAGGYWEGRRRREQELAQAGLVR